MTLCKSPGLTKPLPSSGGSDCYSFPFHCVAAAARPCPAMSLAAHTPPHLAKLTIDTPLGPALGARSAKGLTGFWFEGQKPPRTCRRFPTTPTTPCCRPAKRNARLLPAGTCSLICRWTCTAPRFNNGVAGLVPHWPRSSQHVWRAGLPVGQPAGEPGCRGCGWPQPCFRDRALPSGGG